MCITVITDCFGVFSVAMTDVSLVLRSGVVEEDGEMPSGGVVARDRVAVSASRLVNSIKPAREQVL